MLGFIFFFILVLTFISTFFWAIDAIVHKKKTRIIACVISSLAYLCVNYFLIVGS